MTSRERVVAALNYREADRVPVDIGGTGLSSMHVSVVAKLRQALGLDKPGTPVKVVEPFQMLGEVKPDLLEALGSDVISAPGKGTMFGFLGDTFKPWTTFDGTPVLVPDGFNTEPEPNGDILQYPGGDKSAPASGRMPKGGFYFDAIIRQEPFVEEELRPEDNVEEYPVLSVEDYQKGVPALNEVYRTTDKAIVGGCVGTNFGDIAGVPGPGLKYPKGIRDITEWYMSIVARRDHIYRIFELQCEIALTNLQNYYKAVGDRIQVILISGTDFGSQSGTFMSAEQYCDLFKPFHKRVNDWIHANTPWKTFTHSCGSIVTFLDHFIDAGFDIINPVQTSAAGMDPETLKKRFGGRITFWGGGVDTQRTLPFGTPDEVRKQVKERIRILGPGGGLVFATIHNIQANTPVENILAMIETVRECRDYPIAKASS